MRHRLRPHAPAPRAELHRASHVDRQAARPSSRSIHWCQPCRDRGSRAAPQGARRRRRQFDHAIGERAARVHGDRPHRLPQNRCFERAVMTRGLGLRAWATPRPSPARASTLTAGMTSSTSSALGRRVVEQQHDVRRAGHGRRKDPQRGRRGTGGGPVARLPMLRTAPCAADIRRRRRRARCDGTACRQGTGRGRGP